MLKKLEYNKIVIFIAFLLFILVYHYYAVVDPVLLRNGDDWRYFGSFVSHPIPRVGWWNVTRILPEYLMPLTGYFSAFFIYPLVGDYLGAASVTLALLIAMSITVLFLCLYRLFVTLCDNKTICALVSVMAIILSFAFFKDNPDSNVHMFFATQYNLYFFYVLPNILNSLIVLELMRQLVIRETPATDTPFIRKGWLFVGIYFCIFSMLFSAGILLSFAVAILVHELFFSLRTDEKIPIRLRMFFQSCMKNHIVAVIIVVMTVMAMLLELTSIRSNTMFPETYFGSIFSAEFIRRIGTSAINIYLLARSMSKYIFFIMLFITLTAIVLFIIKPQSRSSKAICLTVKSLIAGLFLFVFYINLHLCRF